ncbi:MAG: hypothetical protein HY592_00080 [Candidatus Omnitrophica bacterium]|nr:hypothetical protein [Candidatus Omnitrophota bacterium]
MKTFHYKSDYLKRFDALEAAQQRLVVFADEEIRRFYEKGAASYGLHVKKLHAGGGGEVFEARASRSLRILWVRKDKAIIFVLVGNHDDVRRYLRNL